VKLGRVLGTVVATVRTPGLEGVRFLAVQPLDKSESPNGTSVVAADALFTAGGDLVYFVASREAAVAMPETFVPIDHAIVGLVDAVDLPGETS